MKYYSAVAVIKFTWDQVATSFWSRYPNPYSKHVLSEDVVSRSVRNDMLYTKRLFTKTNPIPKWGERFVGTGKNVCIVEESVVDADKKVLTTYTRNIGYTKVMVIEEKCTYKSNPDDKKMTLVEREAWVNSDLYGFALAIEAFGVERFKKNAGKAFKGLDYVLHKMYIPESIPEHHTLNTEKLKDTARKVSELTKAKARPVMANCQGNTSAPDV